MSIDVIIPTWQTPPHVLERAINSALATPDVARVLVIDDGSNPPATLTTDDPRVELIHQANAGPSAARNTGLDRAQGDWILLLDDDDELIPEAVSDVVALAISLGAVATVVGRIRVVPAAPPSPGSERPQPAPSEWAGKLLPSPADVFRPITLFNASGTLLARAALPETLRYDTTLKIGEDREFLRRVAERGPIAVASTLAVRAGANGGEGSARLTSEAHLARRAQDHLKLMDRWLDHESEPHFREATRWLLNAMSKRPIARRPQRTYRGIKTTSQTSDAGRPIAEVGAGPAGAGEVGPDGPVGASAYHAHDRAYSELLEFARARMWLTVGQEIKLGFRRAIRRAMA